MMGRSTEKSELINRKLREEDSLLQHIQNKAIVEKPECRRIHEPRMFSFENERKEKKVGFEHPPNRPPVNETD